MQSFEKFIISVPCLRVGAAININGKRRIIIKGGGDQRTGRGRSRGQVHAHKKPKTISVE